jgi:Kef-type K+ transport system membrane component KefB
MKADIVPLLVGFIVFFSSILSLRFRFSVAIVEIILGAVAGYFGLRSEDWMIYLANFGGILLTFLAGTEIDTHLMKRRFKESFLIGSFSFFIPFIVVFFTALFLFHWQMKASLIAGIALSTTSLAVVYSVLIEMGLGKTEIGRLIMAATFITDIGVALTMSILFLKPTFYTALFIAVSVLVIFLATRFSEKIFKNPGLKNKVIEPEIKYIFILLLTFIYFAKLGESHAVLPAFLLGFFMSRHFHETSGERMVINRLRTVSYAIITPIFFIVGGMKISIPFIASGMVIFIVFLSAKLAAKFLGVFFLARKYIPSGSMYTTLLMSTGLTFGTIASVFGLQAGFINPFQYSLLVGVVIASAVIPTMIAQKWFAPVEEEDLLDGPKS